MPDGVLRRTENGSTVVFIHGLFSNSVSAWTHPNGTYWPDLVMKDSAFDGYGVYSFGYDAAFASGNYSLSDVEVALNEALVLDSILDGDQIIFVGHSMGGIIARHFVEARQAALIARNITIGLFLVASPSLGSHFANYFKLMVGIHDVQINALRLSESNIWLNNLDLRFKNLKEGDHLRIFGRELTEANPPALRGFLPWIKIVPQYSAARYFGEPLKVPGSDHTSIAKPSGADDLQHRTLVRLVTEAQLRFAALPAADPPVKPDIPDKNDTSPDPLEDINFRALISADAHGIGMLPGPDATAEQVFEVADQLAKGRFWGRAAAHWLVARSPHTLDIFRHAVDKAAENGNGPSKAQLLWLSSLPSNALSHQEVDDMANAGGFSFVDKMRIKIGLYGNLGRDLEIPKLDWTDEHDLSKFSYDYLQAVAASMARATAENDIFYSILRAIDCARARGDETYHFFDHLNIFGWLPASHSELILTQLVQRKAPKQMLLGFLANLAKRPNPKTWSLLVDLVQSKDAEVSRAAGMALAFQPMTKKQRDAAAPLLSPNRAAYHVWCGMTPSVDPPRAAEMEGEEDEESIAAAWAIARRAPADPVLADALPALVDDADGFRAALLLGALGRTDPERATPIVEERLDYALSTEAFMLRVAQSYIDGPAKMFRLLASSGEDVLYPPYLQPHLYRTYRDAIENAKASTPHLAEIDLYAAW